VLVALAEALSGGRLSDNVAGLALAGSGEERGVFAGVRTFYDLALRDQRSLWPLLLAAGVLAAVTLWRRLAGPYELGFAVSLAVLVVVLRDVGARENHLLDTTALAAVVAAGAWSPGLARGRAARVAVGAAVVLAVALAARHTLLPPVRDVLSGDDAAYDARPFGSLVTGRDCLLAQDPSVPLLLGQRPVVLDPFMLPRLEDREVDVGELVGRIEERRFDRVVLFVRPDVDPFHFRRFDLGPEVANAVQRSYRIVETAPTEPPSYVYAPRAGPRVGCRPAALDDW
jgi:hypothetical protein